MESQTQGSLIVFIGPAGSGKTKIGGTVAHLLGGLAFIDGDFCHRPEAIAKMHQGVPLTEEDREAQLNTFAYFVDVFFRSGNPAAVFAVSALRRQFRDGIRKRLQELNLKICFVLLDVAPEEAVRRIGARKAHFFQDTNLARQQFELFERPDGENDVLIVDGNDSPERVTYNAIEALKKAGMLPAKFEPDEN